jgi:condensin complex subunit 2
LDAGAKIYASRVDSIYSEAYKILGGILVNETDDKDQPENPAHHMREQSRKESYGTTLERNIKALNMSTKGITFGLESFMSEKVREDSLMLWQLLTRDDYSLVLDTLCSSTDAEPWCGNALEACSDSLRKVFMDVSTDVEICSTLSEFEINESQSMENVGSGEIPIHCGDLDYETSQPDYSMLPCPAYLQDSEGEDFGFDDTVESPKGRDPGNEGVLGSKNFTVLYQDPLKIQSVQCDELQLTSTLVKSEYSYFDPTTLSTWAGLQHWKIKPVKLKDAKTIKSRRPKCMKINFRASVSSRTFENHQVTSPSVDGSLKSTNLPMDIHLKPNALHQLFIQGKWKVGKQNMDAFVEDDTEGMQWVVTSRLQGEDIV